MTVQLPRPHIHKDKALSLQSDLCCQAHTALGEFLCHFLLTVVDLDTVKEHLHVPHVQYHVPIMLPFGNFPLWECHVCESYTHAHTQHAHTSFWFRPCWNVTSPRKWCPLFYTLPAKKWASSSLRGPTACLPVPASCTSPTTLAAQSLWAWIPSWSDMERRGKMCAHGWESSTEVGHGSTFFASLYL